MSENLYFGSGLSVAGQIAVVWSDRGLRVLRLLEDSTLADELAGLRQRHPLIENAAEAEKRIKQIDGVLTGKVPASAIALDMEGTAFQQRVWQGLLQVPRGQTISYKALAAKIKKPQAVRAVANACGRNPIALIVPCHRIVSSDGTLGGYYYGLERKRAVLELEGAL